MKILPPDNKLAENLRKGDVEAFNLAWVKWQGGTGFIDGMWNEYQDGGKRQYGLFVCLFVCLFVYLGATGFAVIFRKAESQQPLFRIRSIIPRLNKW